MRARWLPLGLKAALGLHRPSRPADRSTLDSAEDRAKARAITARAPLSLSAAASHAHDLPTLQLPPSSGQLVL